MSEPNRAAVEATRAELFLHGWNITSQEVEIALTAALPHLAPQPIQSDEERANAIENWKVGQPPPFTQICDALAAVRAEERERAAKWHDDRAQQTPDVFEQEFHEVSASAIRAGVTADEWVALPTRKP